MTKEITLPNGGKAFIEKGKGKHAIIAQQRMEGDSSKYLIHLMQQLVKVDGSQLAVEDYEEMDLPDFQAIQIAFCEVNFQSSSPPKI